MRSQLLPSQQLPGICLQRARRSWIRPLAGLRQMGHLGHLHVRFCVWAWAILTSAKRGTDELMQKTWSNYRNHILCRRADEGVVRTCSIGNGTKPITEPGAVALCEYLSLPARVKQSFERIHRGVIVVGPTDAHSRAE